MNINDIKELIKALSNSEVCELNYEQDGVKLFLSKGKYSAVKEVVEKKQIAEKEENNIDTDGEESTLEDSPQGKVVKSPLVGTVYMAPAEGEEPFVSVGDSVKKGQTLAIVEAMKLMNEIECEYDGVIKEICVDNETAVEFGQTLFVIE